MALMPEDLDNKRFTPVRFSEGYDMDEVDNFLDLEVLPRLQELLDENARLTRELDEAHNRIAELESTPREVQPVREDAAAAYEETEPAQDVEEATQVHGVVAAPAAAAPTAESADQSAAGIIALANRLHDEYVKNGEDERDRLIADANSEHRRIVGEAEEKSRTTLEALEVKKSELEKTIEGLRTFERDYRNRLRNYLENQLRDLDTTDTQDKQTSFGL
ncbi:DivIVA domain-containing protein [Brachybacterium sp. JHP9]|uniref:Cell wall synthesis protein Wag31 n=1 Tax=Brachybacterium equifaecis TaxID=2910770 RepID=A0ABT0QWK6_9MICO|nr:DivIVA domain-containing protein [Brachybacterium equifaecis]MCL6422039.1 DivIVA domain-containing protein [Brachybacterium equifaecis]